MLLWAVTLVVLAMLSHAMRPTQAYGLHHIPSIIRSNRLPTLLTSLRSSSLRSLSSSVPPSSSQPTIYALSTPLPPAGSASALAIVRMSGPLSAPILKLLTHYPSSRPIEPRKAYVKRIYSPDHLFSSSPAPPSPPSSSLLDECLTLYFQAPNSSTGEDVVEYHLHGSRAVVSGLLSTLDALSRLPSLPGLSSSRAALRPASPGEFTSRAYTSGKLNLLQVESLADLLSASTAAQRTQALRGFDKSGPAARLYDRWRAELLKALAHGEAVVDFGDDEEQGVSLAAGVVGDGGVWGAVYNSAKALRDEMALHLAAGERGELVRSGLSVCVLGVPNAGKSTLLNRVAGRDAAIVSARPGTTRDVVGVEAQIEGLRIRVEDTAGIRDEGGAEGPDEVEIEGMRRTRIAATNAHVTVVVLDGGDLIESFKPVADLILNKEESQEIMFVANKMDLVPKLERALRIQEAEESIARTLNVSREKINLVPISCKDDEGIESLFSSLGAVCSRRVASLVDHPSASSLDGGLLLTRSRHRHHLAEAVAALSRFEELCDVDKKMGGRGANIELGAEELRVAMLEVGRITGYVDVEEVLDKLFKDFCIGK